MSSKFYRSGDGYDFLLMAIGLLLMAVGITAIVMLKH